jgi:cholesterol oxidase
VKYTDPSARSGFQFTERMVGNVFAHSTAALAAAYTQDMEAARFFAFTVTVRADDLNELLGSQEHEAKLGGIVLAPRFSPDPLTITGGTLEFFVLDPDVPETRLMRYRFTMNDVSGRQFFFEGRKIIRSSSPRNLWRDTTTLYFAVYDGADTTAPELGSGILRIRPVDFLRQITTIQVLNATTLYQRLSGLARFAAFFTIVLRQSYGRLLTELTYSVSGPTHRKARSLRAPEPKIYSFSTKDGVQLTLTRYRAGEKGPVMLAHGLGVSSTIFSTDLIETNLVEYLCANQYDVWLLDLRCSIALPSFEPWDGDQIAEYDYPASIEFIREATGANSVQCVVHCWGATTFFMAMLSGLQGVRSVVSSQIGVYPHSSFDVRIKTDLFVPNLLAVLGIAQLSARARDNESLPEKIYDKALQALALFIAQGRCSKATCHRVTFMYASLYNHAQLNNNIHDHLDELFGAASMTMFKHIATIGRSGKLVDAKGNNVYMPRLRRLNLPITFIHGSVNRCFLISGTRKTYDALCSAFNPNQYTFHAIPGYGHIDCIFGKNACDDVYPYILSHLDRH